MNKLGLHARASAKLTQLASSFQSARLDRAQRPAREREEHHGRDDAGGGPGLHGGDRDRRAPTRQAAIDAIEELFSDKFGEGE